jgi:hypothetical protein
MSISRDKLILENSRDKDDDDEDDWLSSYVLFYEVYYFLFFYNKIYNFSQIILGYIYQMY